MPDSKASTTWAGDLATGQGMVHVDSGTFPDFEVTWQARAERNGGTSPEELIAAAHSSCYCMAFSNGLGKNGTPPEKLDTTATVTFVPGTGITTILLEVKGKVAGIDAAKFNELAEAAKAGCPVSQALKGVDIKLKAELL